MELYVNPTITDFRQDVNGDIKMLKIGVNKEDAYANIIGQAEGADLENNKAKTINVSTYTEPVEVTPTAGKDGMKKATITLSNIPSGATTLYAWRNSNDYAYTLTETPTTSDKLLHVTSSSVTSFGWYDIGYVTEEGIAADESSPIYVRYSSDDVSLT